jgi:hypothetical protein
MRDGYLFRNHPVQHHGSEELGRNLLASLPTGRLRELLGVVHDPLLHILRHPHVKLTLYP